jgi:hypothetical protein
MKISIILTIFVLVVSPMIFTGSAFADYNAGTKTYSCNPDILVAKSDYSYFVYQENKYWSGERPEDIAATLLKSTYPSMMLDNLGLAYHCLKENNIDPDSVARIPPELLQGFYIAKQQDPVKFAGIVPDFDRYVPVPEFGPLAGMITVLSILAVVLVSKRSKI